MYYYFVIIVIFCNDNINDNIKVSSSVILFNRAINPMVSSYTYVLWMCAICLTYSVSDE